MGCAQNHVLLISTTRVVVLRRERCRRKSHMCITCQPLSFFYLEPSFRRGVERTFHQQKVVCNIARRGLYTLVVLRLWPPFSSKGRFLPVVVVVGDGVASLDRTNKSSPNHTHSVSDLLQGTCGL